MANNASENASVKERQDKDKQSLIDILREIPIITVACKKAGIDSSTYYRWRKEDKDFRRHSGDAMEQGFEYINDMSESQIVTLIKEKKIPAITIWLKHHHPRYGSSAKPYVPIADADELTPEENQIVIDALALASGKPIKKLKQPSSLWNQ